MYANYQNTKLHNCVCVCVSEFTVVVFFPLVSTDLIMQQRQTNSKPLPVDRS